MGRSGPTPTRFTAPPRPSRTRPLRHAIALYAVRMKIEEGSRDTKSHRVGFALDYARSGCVERLQALLLIGTLGVLMCCLLGLAAQARSRARRFPANTERKRTVLSVMFLGRQVFRSRYHTVSPPDLRAAARVLPRIIAEHALAFS